LRHRAARVLVLALGVSLLVLGSPAGPVPTPAGTASSTGARAGVAKPNIVLFPSTTPPSVATTQAAATSPAR